MKDIIEKSQYLSSKYPKLLICRNRSTVSWKTWADKAYTRFKIWAANDVGIEITAAECYTTEKGKLMERQVMIGFNRDEIKALRDYFDDWLAQSETESAA